MTGIDVLIKQATWCAANMAHNLDFIPDDKLNWKPAEGAKSALEIAVHTIGAIYSLSALIDGSTPIEMGEVSSRDAAKTGLIDAAEQLVIRLKSLNDEQINSIVKDTPLGDLPMAQVIQMPVVDLLHHHGQIAYIQTLLGDNEMHFVQF